MLGLNVFVTGSAGTGKTSFLLQLKQQLEADGCRCILISLPDGDESEMSQRLARQLDDALGVVEPPTFRVFGDLAKLTASSRPPTLAKLFEGWFPPSNDRPTILLLDDVSARAAAWLFVVERRAVSNASIRWVASGRSVPSGDGVSFFDRMIHLGSISEDDAAELLRRRAATLADHDRQFLESQIDRIVSRVTPATPLHLLLASQDLLINGAADSAFEDLLARTQGVTDPGRLVLGELRKLGATSSSDPELQAATGLSRTRLVQILNELRGAGLVTDHRVGRRVEYVPVTEAGDVR
jgi:hypothetical protein